ncbi:MAG: hypothetical protein GY950_37770 [bacterium]|nr:hypothetical protein [bacterium]
MMSFINYFKPVETIKPDAARSMIKGKKPDEICILDVRQPKEYEQGHIPGAVLIPIAELPDRLGELNPETPTIVYCAIGGRSRAGASILQDAGFAEAYNLKGGFNVWNGLSADGPPETGMAYFKDLDNVEEILILAWVLEEGSRCFYQRMTDITGDDETKELYNALAMEEVNHQSTIKGLYYEITGTAEDTSTPFQIGKLPGNKMEQLMEGQLRTEEVLAWARRHSPAEVLDFAIAMEAKLYDLYMRMEKKYPEPTVNKVYSTLAEEEKKHLDLFTSLLEKKLN